MTAAHSNSGRLRRVISVIGMLGAIAVGAAGFVALASMKPEPRQTPPTKKTYNVDVFVVHKHRLRETISGFGTARPDREVILSAQVAGAVQEHNLEIGQRVVANGPILQIDPDSIRRQYEQVQNQLAEGESELSRLKQERANAERLLKQAKSDFATAQEQYQRRQTLRSRDVVTSDELARALLDFRKYEEAMIRQENEAGLYPLKIDQVEKRQATTKSALELAKIDLNHTQVAAPFAGVVSEVFAETGQYVRVGDPLVKITNTQLVEIPVPIKLSDYAKLSPLLDGGQSPQVDLAASVSNAAQWTGRLTRTAPKADVENRTIEVYVEVDNAEQSRPLLPGTFVHARMEGPVLEEVFAIPRDAIIGGHVLIARPGTNPPVVQQQIEPRETLETLALLDGGVKEGDQLILTNLDVLYRDPSEIREAVHEAGRTLSINRTQTLEDLLNTQKLHLVQILDAGKERSGGRERAFQKSR